jgi:cubilin
MHVTGCGRAYTADHGVITSPDYPNPYAHNSYCIYTISVPAGEVITFNVTNIDIEDHPNCYWDYLEVNVLFVVTV